MLSCFEMANIFPGLEFIDATRSVIFAHRQKLINNIIV